MIEAGLAGLFLGALCLGTGKNLAGRPSLTALQTHWICCFSRQGSRCIMTGPASASRLAKIPGLKEPLGADEFRQAGAAHSNIKR